MCVMMCVMMCDDVCDGGVVFVFMFLPFFAGSAFRGWSDDVARSDYPAQRYHINGNAFYQVGSKAFRYVCPHVFPFLSPWPPPPPPPSLVKRSWRYHILLVCRSGASISID